VRAVAGRRLRGVHRRRARRSAQIGEPRLRFSAAALIHSYHMPTLS
jgi:hypothetical protein